MPLVAHPDLDGDAAAEADVVLDKEPHCPLIDHAPPFAQRDVEGIGLRGQECVHAREVEDSRAFGEVLVDEVTILAAEFQRVAAVYAAERVAEHVRRVGAPLGERSRSTEVEISGDDHLGQADGPRDPIGDAEVRRIERRCWKRTSLHVAAAEHGFVDERGSEEVCPPDGQDARKRL